MTDVRVLLGPPGTGKTESLLRHMEQLLQKGTSPERVAFLSFSRRAIGEAKERAAQVVPDAPLPNFRTIHSLAYRLLELKRDDVVGPEHMRDFGERVGLTFDEGSSGHKALTLIGLSAARTTSLRAEWERTQGLGVPWPLVQRTAEWYARFKSKRGLLDFHDMVARAEGTLDVDVLFVDEAQDCTPAQWAFLKRVAGEVPLAYFAGDDDQAIYQWSGADPLRFARFLGQRSVLPQSYRLPRTILELSRRVRKGITQGIPKSFAPRPEEGRVEWFSDLAQLDLTGKDTWLLLARNNYQLRELRQLARQQGVVYTLGNGAWSWSTPAVQAAVTYERLRKGGAVARRAALEMARFRREPTMVELREPVEWTHVHGLSKKETWMTALTAMSDQDREYLRALRRTGESLSKPGRVRIDTVHGAKGAQADHVALLTDIGTQVAEAALVDPDAERRVQYVGVTRARHSLHLMFPTTSNFWSF